MPRLYREAPVNGIWEGTGNVICLDILRTAARAPDALAAFVGELKRSSGADKRLDTYVGRLEQALTGWEMEDGRWDTGDGRWEMG